MLKLTKKAITQGRTDGPNIIIEKASLLKI